MTIIAATSQTYSMLGGVVALLTLASAMCPIIKRRATSEAARATAADIASRTKSWWMMVIIFAVAVLTGPKTSVVLFALTSFLALREYVTITPTQRADHRTLFWVFFILLPMQYYFLFIGWYGMFAIFIPVYAFLLVPLRSVLADDPKNFLQRTSEIQWGLMICIYCVSHAPALMLLKVKGFEGQNANLLFYLVLVVEMSDVLQYIWGKAFGKRKIAPNTSPNKTVAGFVGGSLSAALIGTTLYAVTPFSLGQALIACLLITTMGFFGDLTMSAIKRDRGVKDYGSLIPGHGGVLDRIDSLCFAAPVFFHFVRYFHGS